MYAKSNINSTYSKLVSIIDIKQSNLQICSYPNKNILYLSTQKKVKDIYF